jgi:hypothetical protein
VRTATLYYTYANNREIINSRGRKVYIISFYFLLFAEHYGFRLLIYAEGFGCIHMAVHN